MKGEEIQEIKKERRKEKRNTKADGREGKGEVKLQTLKEGKGKKIRGIKRIKEKEGKARKTQGGHIFMGTRKKHLEPALLSSLLAGQRRGSFLSSPLANSIMSACLPLPSPSL